MNPADRIRLQSHYEKLVDDVKYYHVSAHLISTFVIDFKTDAQIKSAKTEQEQMEKLLGFLLTRGDDAFQHFITALKKTSPWLAESLMQNHPAASTAASDDDKANNNNSKQMNEIEDYDKRQLEKISDASIADYIVEVRKSLESSPTVCRNWKTVAQTMRLHHTTVLDIEENNRYRASNALYDVLRSWVDEAGHQKATFSKLIDILKTERMVFAADEVELLWLKLCSSPSSVSCKLS